MFQITRFFYHCELHIFILMYQLSSTSREDRKSLFLRSDKLCYTSSKPLKVLLLMAWSLSCADVSINISYTIKIPFVPIIVNMLGTHFIL